MHVNELTTALRQRPGRAAVVALGMAVGVAAVILLVGVGAAARAKVGEELGFLGTDTVTVFPDGSGRGGLAPRPPDERDVEALTDPRLAPSVLMAVPVESAQTVLVAGDRAHRPGLFLGSTAAYGELSGLRTTTGVLFDDGDVIARRPVAVLGTTPAKRLFPRGDAVGRELRVGRAVFSVIGVIEDRGRGLLFDQNDVVLVPHTALADASLDARRPGFTALVVQARPSARLDRLAPDVTAALRAARHVPEGDPADVVVVDQATAQRQAAQIGRVFTVLLGATGALSLLVAALGVANVVAVGVHERTAEIGLRLALGAPRRTIVVQFLAEAATLAVLGAVAGALVAVGVHTVAPHSGVVFVPAAFVAATAGCVVAALLAALVPAWRGACLDPVAALRTR